MSTVAADRPEDHVRWAMAQALGVVREQKAYGRKEEAVAEGLRGMCEAWKRYEPERGEFEPFAGERVRGAVRRFLSRDRRLSAMEILYDHTEALDGALDGPGDAWTRLNRAVRAGADAVAFDVQLREAAAEPERDEELARELKRLSPAERELLELRFEQGLSWKEVGQRLGISASGAKHRGEKLREKLRAARTRNGR